MTTEKIDLVRFWQEIAIVASQLELQAAWVKGIREDPPERYIRRGF